MFDHRYIDNQAKKTLVLLHGTGGSKSDFLFLDGLLSKSYNLLGLQGTVLENGMSRFFRRSSVGVFDQESIKQEAQNLLQFLTQWCVDHTIKREELVFLGYSNGANILLATLFYYPESIRVAALLHPMVPFVPQNIFLTDHTFFISTGKADPMVSQDQKALLISTMQKTGASLVTKEYPGGHEISKQEIQDVVSFLRQVGTTRIIKNTVDVD